MKRLANPRTAGRQTGILRPMRHRTPRTSATNRVELAHGLGDRCNSLAGSDPALVFALVAAAVAVRLALMIAARGTLIDDAYITLRYGRNLALGHGPVYNPGERVLGAPPIWIFVTGTLWRLASFFSSRPADAGYFVSALNAALSGAVCWLLARVTSAKGSLLAWAPLILFAFFLPFLDNATSGMETTLFVLALLLGYLDVLRGRPGRAALVLGASILVRPEGVLWIAALALVLLLRGVRPRLRSIWPVALVPGTWWLFATLYYGTPVPHNAVAKSGWSAGSTNAGALLARLVDILKAFTFVSNRGPGSLADAFALPLLALVLALAVIGAVDLARKRAMAFAWAAFFALLVLFFLVGRGALWPSWYAIPPGLAFAIVASHGVARVLEKMRTVGAREIASASPGASASAPASRRERGAAFPVIAAGVGALVLALSISGWVRLRLPYYRIMRDGYERTGECIAARPAGEVILVEEIGYIGYLADRPILDLAGIVTPEILTLRRGREEGEVVDEIVARWNPGSMALRAAKARRFAESRPDGPFAQRYRAVLETRPYAVYERTAVPGLDR